MWEKIKAGIIWIIEKIIDGLEWILDKLQ